VKQDFLKLAYILKRFQAPYFSWFNRRILHI